jgi:hypothetical protein
MVDHRLWATASTANVQQPAEPTNNFNLIQAWRVSTVGARRCSCAIPLADLAKAGVGNLGILILIHFPALPASHEYHATGLVAESEQNMGHRPDCLRILVAACYLLGS